MAYRITTTWTKDGYVGQVRNSEGGIVNTTAAFVKRTEAFAEARDLRNRLEMKERIKGARS
jgi:hypothetical protein